MQRLKNNTPAIPFIANDYLGNSIDLSKCKGKKVLLSFFRDASCPFCNLRVNQLIKKHEDFEKNGIAIIIFFAASENDIAKYAGKQHAPFPIIPDPDLVYYKKYGVEKSVSGMFTAMLKPIKMLQVMTSGFFNLNSMNSKPLIPADFLIDENQNIYKTYYGKDFGDHLPINEILTWK